LRYIKYINPDEILYIQTNYDGNTVKVQLVNGVGITLKKWQEDYDLPGIMRIHKSYLVNLNPVNGHKPAPFKDEGHNVTFRDSDKEMPVGKTYLDGLLKALGRTNTLA
jgi:DNA-binding LytR/AlgR family response regulator